MRRGGALILLAPLGFIVAFVLVVLLLLQPPDSSACATDPAGPATGNLGGVSGTGITAAELAIVRASPLAGRRITEGVFRTTAYGPPWGVDPVSGVDQGAGIATAGGLRLNGGAPRKYLVATDPSVISLGQLIYIWPNPFGWRGPFLTADTGGAINGRDIDFYDWRGRETQLAWSRPAEVSRTPNPAFGPAPGAPPDAGSLPAPAGSAGATGATGASGTTGTVGDCGASTPAGALGELTGTPQEIVNGVVAYANANGFANVTVASNNASNAGRVGRTTNTGSRSDHQGPPDRAWAADISNGDAPTREMDALAAAIAGAFEIPWQGSGLVTAGDADYRIQLIYRTCAGADHWNHVHMGIARGPGPRPATTQPSTPRPC